MSADHDPLCNKYDESRALCNCGPGSLIARARADERQQARQRVEAAHACVLDNKGRCLTVAHDFSVRYAAAAGGDA